MSNILSWNNFQAFHYLNINKNVLQVLEMRSVFDGIVQVIFFTPNGRARQ